MSAEPTAEDILAREDAADDRSFNQTVTMPKELACDALEELYELQGERDWWKDEPRCNYQARYAKLCQIIGDLEVLTGYKS